MEEKRLIEVDFPLEEVSQESVREKNIRKGHISKLHVWWTWKPLATCRAAVFGSLVKNPETYDKRKELLDFMKVLCKWESSWDQDKINRAKKYIRESTNEETPRVLDCFAGIGSIPLEALRLGCDAFSLELNPVAVLINKVVLDFSHKYGKEFRNSKNKLSEIESYNPLSEDIKKWGEWILKEANKEIGIFYPKEKNKWYPQSYIWVRTIKCKKPSCGTEIPLITNFWLQTTKIAFKPVIDKKNKIINFKIVKDNEIDFDPSEGITKYATAICPICSSVINANELKSAAREGLLGQRLIIVALRYPNTANKKYRIARKTDLELFEKARKALELKTENWEAELSPIPNEPLPTPDRRGPSQDINSYFNFAPVVLYGMKSWGDLFNSRQKLSLITFIEKVRLVHDKILERGAEEEYARAITTCLAFAVDSLSHYSCKISLWLYEHMISAFIQGTSLPMRWNYAEANPFGERVGSWSYAINQISEIVSKTTLNLDGVSIVNQGTATNLPYQSNYFDLVITDPPYYNSVPYSDLSDFFYVWLKRIIGDLYPDLFTTPLTPKSHELIENLSLTRGAPKEEILRANPKTIKSKEEYEKTLTKTFIEIRRVTKPEGIVTIIFAHRSTEAWETIINSLLKSGLVLTASWPIRTERTGRLRARNSAVLASSVIMICRKRKEPETAYFNEIKDELKNSINTKLKQFWEQGIGGADFFISAIGPAVEVFGKYSRVERLSGEEVTVQELLEYVRKIVSEFALERVLRRTDLGGVDAETRFYLLWRWIFGNAKVPFDEGIKLSRPMGIELTDIWNRGELIKKEKQYIRVLGPKEREKDENFLRKKRYTSMIDVLHRVLISWDKGERQDINEILVDTGYLKNELFWQTAQALSEILPDGDKEKQLIQGFLYGRETYFKEEKRDKTLFEFMEKRKE